MCVQVTRAEAPQHRPMAGDGESARTPGTSRSRRSTGDSTAAEGWKGKGGRGRLLPTDPRWQWGTSMPWMHVQGEINEPGNLVYAMQMLISCIGYSLGAGAGEPGQARAVLAFFLLRYTEI